MSEPTKAQIKEVWEGCGWRYGKYNFVSSLSSELNSVVDGWLSPEATTEPYKSEYFLEDLSELELNLNNLFRYAEHLFVSIACGLINEENWKGAWAKVITHDRQKIGEIRKEGLTPTLALLWAIWKVIHNV